MKASEPLLCKGLQENSPPLSDASIETFRTLSLFPGMDRNAASRSLYRHRLRHIPHFVDVRLKGINV